MKEFIRKIMPGWMIDKLNITRNRLARVFIYRDYDASEYWKSRAACTQQSAVLWQNEEYNQLYRARQKEILKAFICKMPGEPTILDICCGTGVVAHMLAELHPGARIDGVDFPEMIQIAKKIHAHPRIKYIESSAEDYSAPQGTYDMILSSGGFAAIRDITKMERAMSNAVSMLASDGLMLMIDPFHRWKFLARVRYNTKDVKRLMKRCGLTIVHKSGVLFWPSREKLANSHISGEKLRKKFERGEKCLAVLGRHYWADYKILAFRFNNNSTEQS
jgi:2-polyprenyl-3-methyl-5-hydroxy-6-metoxy-1,4-benzoquinol methylase